MVRTALLTVLEADAPPIKDDASVEAVTGPHLGGAPASTWDASSRTEDVSSRSEDVVAQAVRQVLVTGPFVEVDYQVVPDEQAMIRARLRLWADAGNVDLVLTTGGIGLGLKGRTPEATAEVIERSVPGLAEAMRRELAQDHPTAMLTRGLAGVRRSTLVLNLPGSPSQARAALQAVIGVLPHAVRGLSAGPVDLAN